MKNIIKFLKKNIFLIITLICSFLLLFLISENISKVIIIEIFIWLWFLLGNKLKNFTYSSFLLIFLVLPLNLSLQISLPSIDPYVNGIFTNYLVPTLSILDLFTCLLLLSSLIEKKLNKKMFTFEIPLLILFSLLQFIFNREIVSLMGIFRIVLYLLSFRVVVENKLLKQRKYIIILSQVLIIFELIIAVLQFKSGSSIGLSFLGESIFSAGMKGSSFLDISGNLYVRGYGTFPHPNILAGWFLMNIVLLWKYRKGFAFLLLSSLGIVLTFSRMGIFLMVLFWILYIYEYIKEKKGMRIFSFFALLNERVINLFNSGDSAIQDRINLLKESFKIFKNNWISGTGYNVFVKEMGDSMPRTANGVLLNQPVHNVLMLSLCELGIPGTIILGVAYWRTFFTEGLNLKNIQNIFILISLISIFMVDHYMFSLPQGLIIGMMMLEILSAS